MGAYRFSLEDATSPVFFGLLWQILESMLFVAREVGNSGLCPSFRDFFWYYHPLGHHRPKRCPGVIKRKAISLAKSIVSSLAVRAWGFPRVGGHGGRGQPDHGSDSGNHTEAVAVGPLSTSLVMMSCLVTAFLVKRTVIKGECEAEQHDSFLGTWRERILPGGCATSSCLPSGFSSLRASLQTSVTKTIASGP